MNESTEPSADYDVVIAGAGPAGLSAALVLGRACRSVLLCDTNTPRSWASKAVHGFLTRDGIAPDEFRRIAHAELSRYETVEYREAEVTGAARLARGGFEVTIGSGEVTARKLLIATGVLDHLPSIPGIEEYFGTTVFQCPYCDGWELRGEPIAVYGKRQPGLEIARALTAWTDDIVLCTDGPSGLTRTEKTHLRRNRIDLREARITGLDGASGRLEAIVFEDGLRLRRAALFFDMPASGQSKLAESLGCQFTKHGGVRCGRYEASSVPGVFVAGNIIKDVQLAIVAAAEGASAAFGINKALTREAFARRAEGSERIEHPGPTGGAPE